MWYSASLASQPQVQAARLSMLLLHRLGEEYGEWSERAHQLRLEMYELKFGVPARFRLERDERRLGFPRDFRDQR